MEAAHRQPLLDAFRVLFDEDPGSSPVPRVQPARLRAAWRRRALGTHPDRVLDPAAKRRATERFIEVARAYELLRDHLAACGPRERRPPAAPRRPAPRRASPPRPPAHPRPAAPPAGVPRRQLRIGEFLLRSRAISFEHLVAAIVWQRRQRERFCEICRRWGLFGVPETSRLLAGRRPGEPVGEAARRLRLLSRAEVGAVLAFQRRRQRPIGEYFLDHGVLSPAALERLLGLCAAHNAACPPRRR